MEETIFDIQHLKKTYFKMATPVVLGMIVSLIYNLAVQAAADLFSALIAFILYKK